MIYLFSGLMIGLVMGLTGAGGALVALPLFIHLAGLSIQEASVLSLLAVFIASVLNFIPVRGEADLRASIQILPFTFISGHLTVPLKASVTGQAITGMVLFVSAFALYSVWVPGKTNGKDRSLDRKISVPLTGILSGTLTTFTGLGGGVVLVPALRFFFRMPMKRAVATGLVLIAASSFFSFIFQWGSLRRDPDILYLVPGMILSVFLLKLLFPGESELARKWIFTLVVLGTSIGLLF